MNLNRAEIQLLEITAKTLKKLGIRPRKELGQHFLISENIRDRIIKLISPAPDETIIEIGGGLGALTFPLAESASKLIVYELDDNLRNFLTAELNLINRDVEILGDFLKGYPLSNLQDRKFKIVGNIPYRITAPIFEKIYNSDILPSETIIMVQREVADRLTSRPPSSERGRLTIWCEFHATIMDAFNVRKGSFYPQPDVGSKIIRLSTREHIPLVKEQKLEFFEMIKMSFAMKRKTLANNLVRYREGIEKTRIESIIEGIGLKKSVRAEELSIEQFVEIFKILSQKPI